MKVLVVGMEDRNDRPETSNWLRHVGSYQGVEAVFANGQTSGDLPTADAALLVTSFMSHNRFWQAKEHCKRLKIPWCGVSSGWSSVQPRFEEMLRGLGMVAVRTGQPRPEKATLADAFKSAKILPTAPEPKREHEVKTRVNTDGRSLRPEFKADLRALMGQKLTNRQITEKLTAAGWRKKNQKQLMAQDVINYMHRQNKQTKPTVRATAQTSAYDLIGRVLAAKNISADRKIELVEEIHAGVRTTDQQVIAERKGDKLQITLQSIFHAEDKALAIFDKVTAVAVLSCLKSVQAFVDGVE